MGFFGRLFGGAPDPAAAERLFAEGRALFWARETDQAEDLLSRAAPGHPKPALPLAYRSLLRRNQMKVPAALKDANAAVARDPGCHEAHAALCAALLTDPARLTDAIMACNRANECTPHDADGHYLRLLLFVLLFDTLMGAEEDAEGVTFHFRHTPLTRLAIRLLECREDLARTEFGLLHDYPAPVAALARGITLYREGEKDGAERDLQAALDSMGSAAPSHTLLSLKRLLLEVRKSPGDGSGGKAG